MFVFINEIVDFNGQRGKGTMNLKGRSQKYSTE